MIFSRFDAIVNYETAYKINFQCFIMLSREVE